MENFYLITFLFVAGLCMGSFLLATVWRLHAQEDGKKVRKAVRDQLKQDKNTLSIAKGRSICEYCGHRLQLADLVPLVSWVLLRGRCRYCKHELSWQYPFAELLTGVLFVVSYLEWPLELHMRGSILLFLWLLYLSGLIALAVYDIRWFILPNAILYPMIVGVIVHRAVDALLFLESASPIREAVLGLLVGGGFFYLLFTISKGVWIGGGDVKLGFFFGILLGPILAFVTIFLASMAASVVTLAMIAAGRMKRKQQLPFGPYLIAATIIVVLYGDTLVNWYSRQFLGY